MLMDLVKTIQHFQNCWKIGLINQTEDHLMNTKTHKTPGLNVKRFQLLTLNFKKFCDSMDQNHKSMIWTLFGGFFHIKQQLSMKRHNPDDPWGVERIVLRLTVPLMNDII